MGSTPQQLILEDETTNLIDDLNTFISGVPGWVVDKYTTDDELYIHNTSSDGTIGYYSVKYVDTATTYIGTLLVYCNLGYDNGLAVNAQPGVMSNSSTVASFSVNFGYDNFPRVAHFLANEDYFLITALVPEGISELSTYVYSGILEKAFTYTGGNIITGNVPTALTPTMVWYHDGDSGDWYTMDSGAFADSGGLEADMNVVNYESSQYAFDTSKRTIRINPYEVFVEHDGGFAPIGSMRNLWFAYNDEMLFYFPIYSYTVLNGISYFSIPTGAIDSDQVITISPGI